MKKFICLIVIVIMVCGCASRTSRLKRLNENGENVVSLKLEGSIEEVKEIVKLAAKDLEFVEMMPKDKIENYMELHYVNAGLATRDFFTGAAFGMLGTVLFSHDSPTSSSIGVWFEYNEENDYTALTLSEEATSLSRPLRHDLVNLIKLKSSEMQQFSNGTIKEDAAENITSSEVFRGEIGLAKEEKQNSVARIMVMTFDDKAMAIKKLTKVLTNKEKFEGEIVSEDSIKDSEIKGIVASLDIEQYSDVLEAGDGRYYIFKKVND